MAIGSEGEIGKSFGIWKDMSDVERRAWWDYMKEHWIDSGNLMAGYATLQYAKRDNNERRGDEQDVHSVPTD